MQKYTQQILSQDIPEKVCIIIKDGLSLEQVDLLFKSFAEKYGKNGRWGQTPICWISAEAAYQQYWRDKGYKRDIEIESLSFKKHTTT